MRLVEVKDGLPPEVVKAFLAIADMQRGKPEFAMLRVQRAMGGGVLSRCRTRWRSNTSHD